MHDCWIRRFLTDGLPRHRSHWRCAATDVEPTAEDIDRVLGTMKESWTATITVKRQSPHDLGYREIIGSLDG